MTRNSGKIIRTPTKAYGGITAAEKSQMADHAALWIERAMRTEQIEPEKIIPAIERLYDVTGLKRPRVVIVPSPLVMAFSYGAAAAVLHNRSATASATRSATRSATDSATDSATYIATRSATASATDIATRSATASATDSATYIATRSATASATDSATASATRSATHSATRSATRSATDSATYIATASATHSATRSATASATDSATANATRSATASATDSATASATDSATANATRSATASATDSATASATYIATRNATASATRSAKEAALACFEIAGDFGLQCAARWLAVYQGGNMWAGYDCYLTAARDILGLRLPEHEAYSAWEQAAIHGGFRVMHPEFCIVSDFPERILVDDQNRPHCPDGPSHRWRDGWSLYHWHGVRVPAEWIENPDALDAKTAVTWLNVEERRAAIEILGWSRVLGELDAKSLGGNPDPKIGELIEVHLPFEDDDGNDTTRALFLKAQCGTGRTIFEAVDPDEIDLDPRFDPAWCAQAWRDGYSPADWLPPSFRT